MAAKSIWLRKPGLKRSAKPDDATPQTFEHGSSEHLEDNPDSAYQRRLEQRKARWRFLEAGDSYLSIARGLAFFGGLIALCFWYFSGSVPIGVAGVLFTAFFGLVLLHGPVRDRLNRARLAVSYYERSLARLAARWPGGGSSGERYSEPSHLYADDLDFFGRGSLFELLCQARTRLGEDTLAAWLRAPATGETIRKRQEAVDELRRNVDLREKLAVLDAAVHHDYDQNRLVEWSTETAQPINRRVRLAAWILAGLAIGALAASAIPRVGLSPFVFRLIVEGIFFAWYGRRIKPSARGADQAASGLAILAQVLAVIEREQFRCALLADVRRRLETHGHPPSREIASLERLVRYLNNCLRNQFFAPLAFVVCLPIHLTHAVEAWRSDVGPRIPDWLRAVGEFEALVCLSGFAFENPAAPFPEIVESSNCFHARQLGHPLIPQSQCVRNDVRLDDETRLILVSGSNMSGKSTLLRTIGVNLVLAFAGAPVCAECLTTSVLQIGTAMRIRDSLLSGESLFYAAVSRLKTVVERAEHGGPLLFLFDEILQGTNSHDRLIGSEAVLRTLVERGAIGLITTHDLALTEVAQRLGSRAINVHFEDNLIDGKMTFDYRLRPGVVRKSNALELMRLMGLDV
jgi:hypothetical protein